MDRLKEVRIIGMCADQMKTPEILSNLVKVPGPVGCAMVTPFLTNGELDVDSAQNLAKHLVDNGVDHLILSGTTGESPTTHQPEKNLLIKAVREAVGEEIFITAGAGSNDTAHAVRIAEGSAESGADGLLVVSPYYNRPSQEGLYQHVKAVTQATELPVILYDIPGRTGLAFSDGVIDRLCELPNVIGVKDATGNVPQGEARLDRTGLAFFSGDDSLNYAWMASGAYGIISVVVHVAPQQFAKFVKLMQEGAYQEARKLAAQLRSLINAIMGSGQGAVMAKHALVLQGQIKHATVRLPLVEAGPAQVEELSRILDHYFLR